MKLLVGFKAVAASPPSEVSRDHSAALRYPDRGGGGWWRCIVSAPKDLLGVAGNELRYHSLSLPASETTLLHHH